MSKQNSWAQLGTDPEDEGGYAVINLAQATKISFGDFTVQGHDDAVRRIAEVEMSDGDTFDLYDDNARAAERWVKARRIEEG